MSEANVQAVSSKYVCSIEKHVEHEMLFNMTDLGRVEEVGWQKGRQLYGVS